MSKGLTDRQAQCLLYINHSIQKNGYPPTLREICDHMGVSSTNGVNDHLRALERKGFIIRDSMKSRAIKITDQEKVNQLEKSLADPMGR